MEADIAELRHHLAWPVTPFIRTAVCPGVCLALIYLVLQQQATSQAMLSKLCLAQYRFRLPNFLETLRV
jgi:hypothetical protein